MHESPRTTEAAWEELHGRLLSFLRARVSNDADAEDLLQDVFARIHANAQKLTEVDSVTGWIFRLTRNAVVDFHRSKARRPEQLLPSAEDVVGEAVAPEEGAETARSELTACIEPLLARLPERYSKPLLLTELAEMAQKEAAEQMGLSLPAMKSRVSRGRAKLKDLFLDCCHIELDRRRGIADVRARPNREGACNCQCGSAPPPTSCS